jgi:serine/threonine protein phosphatase PrpC
MSISNTTLQLDKKEDFSFSTKINNNIWLVVADGHASLPKYSYNYRTVIEYISKLDWEKFLKINYKNPLEALQESINCNIQDTKHNGATITIVNIDNNLNKIKVWWKGDSLAHIYEDNELMFKTSSHNIFNEKEKERLKRENIEYIQDKKGTNFKFLGNNCIKMVKYPSYIILNIL